MQNVPKLLLTGGTGQLGRTLLKGISTGPLRINVMTRNKGVDPSTADLSYITADLSNYGTLETLGTDYDIVVHCASDPRKSDSIDREGTRNLLKGLKDSSIKHFVYISILGVDKTTYPYYQNKLRAENLIIASGIPYTILRIAQFHNFVHDRILNPVMDGNESFTIPTGLEFQSIDLIDVCEEIQESIKRGPTNSILKIGGPEVLTISEIVEIYENTIPINKKITMTTHLNDFQKLFTTGINLCPDHKRGKITWKDYLLKKRKERHKH